MTPVEYIHRETAEGRLTRHHIVTLTEIAQEALGLTVDGMPGPNTRAALERHDGPLRCWPLPELEDGRKPTVTSRSRWHNPGRPGHDGVDLMWPYLGSDPEVHPRRCVIRGGERRWWIPPAARVVAAGPGRVHMAGEIATGMRCWIDHGDIRTGYFHLRTLDVGDGDEVEAGTILGSVGADPRGGVAHLHFEVSPVDRYEPLAPEPYLDGLGTAG